tara:strand:- start:43 stop:1572 length:1530 start_codon:yes stop_codon:yes gene_type:complete
MSSPYYRFDGVDDKVALSDGTALDFTSEPFTISFKLNPLDTGSNRVIWTKGVHNASGWYVILSNGATASVSVYGSQSSAYQVTSSTSVFSEGSWQDLTIVRSGTSVTIYRNGVNVTNSSGTHTDPVSGSSNETRFGLQLNNTYDYLGEMSSIKVFNNALSATEVKELYSGASVPFKYKGANQTDLVANGADWSGGSPPTSWLVYRASAVAAGSGVAGNCVALTRVSDDAQYLYQTRTLTIGKYYRLSAYVQTGTSGHETFEIAFRAGTLGGVLASVTGTSSDTWTQYSVDWLCTQSAITVSLTKTTGTAGTMSFDSAVVVPIGAVAEYDGSGASDTVWYDKSGNDLNGTVTGATLENKLDTIQVSGITFPATAHASANPNTLDDYEEGTDTVVLAAASGTAGLDAGYNEIGYTKVGRAVHIQGHLYNTTDSSADGALTITGLPFTAVGELTDKADTASLLIEVSGGAASDGIYRGSIMTGTTVLTIEGYDAENLDTSTSIYVSGTYFTA